MEAADVGKKDPKRAKGPCVREFYDDRYLKKLSGSMERFRAFHQADNASLYRDLVRWELLRHSMRILDVGCGWAIHSDLMSRHHDVLAIKTDLSLIALQALIVEGEPASRNRVPYVVADLQALPFEDGSFDLVMCSQVLEHVPDDLKGLSECYRVLISQGMLFIAAPNCFQDMYRIFHSLQKHFDQSGHIHQYCIEGIRRRLIGVGFNVQRERYHCFFVFWSVALLERLRIGKVVQRMLVALPLLEAATRFLLTILLLSENRLLGNTSRGGMSIEFIARKRE